MVSPWLEQVDQMQIPIGGRDGSVDGNNKGGTELYQR
jgi:hypothetical protein